MECRAKESLAGDIIVAVTKEWGLWFPCSFPPSVSKLQNGTQGHLELNNIMERHPKRPRRSGGGAGGGSVSDDTTPPSSNSNYIITPITEVSTRRLLICQWRRNIILFFFRAPTLHR